MNANELSALEEELKRDLDAISRVRRILAAKSGAITPVVAVSVTPRVAHDVSEDGRFPIISLRGKIEDVINADPSTQWTPKRCSLISPWASRSRPRSRCLA